MDIFDLGSFQFGTLLLIGIGVFGGIIGAALFQKLRIPQVIGYIAIGVLVGKTGLKIIDQEVIDSFRMFNFFALGIIGFLVGGELLWSTLRKYGKQFSGILLGEGLLSFFLVTLFTGGVIYFITRNIRQSLAVGVVFGALASATDPAATMDVLWEYRAAGILTTTIIAIVALDDAFAMTLYGIGSGVSRALMGGEVSAWQLIRGIGAELFGAVALGIAGGFIMIVILRFNRKRERIIAYSVGLLLLIIGAAQAFGMDIIFAAMALGITVRNIAKERSSELFELIKRFSTPIYVLFFVLVGARLQLADMPWWMWLLVGCYCAARNGGKIIGALIGGKAAKAHPNVQRYTGLGLSAQGGVAIGLAIMASRHLDQSFVMGMSLGEIVIFTVTTTTFIFQITGPPLIQLAAKLSGERGKNITPEDIIEKWKVSDVLKGPAAVFNEGDTLRSVVETFSAGENHIYPVVDTGGRFLGTIAFEDIKEVLTDQEIWEWLLAGDIVKETNHTVRDDTPLQDALDTMKQLRREQLPVVDGDGKPMGALDNRQVNLAVEQEIITIKGESR